VPLILNETFVYKLHEKLSQLYPYPDLNPESDNQRQIYCTAGFLVVSDGLSTLILEYVE
jgi:hypothetical protein